MASEKRLIDANALLVNLTRMNDLGDAILACPTVDAVEVVRCKDCKHWAQLESGGFCDNPEGLLCFDKPNDFCCYGERKDNG